MTNRLATGLKVFLNGLVLNAFFCAISFFTIKYSGIWYLPLSILVCFFISCIGEVVVKKTKHNFIAFLGCLMVAALALGIGLLSFSYINGSVFAAAVLIWLLLYRFNKNFFEISFPHKSFILLFLLAYFISICFDVRVLKFFACAEGIVFLLGNTFMEGFSAHEKFIKENRNVQNFPQEQIRKTYLSLLTIFVCVCFLVVILITSIKIPQESLSNWISDVLHDIYELLPKYDGRIGAEIPDVGMGGGNPYEEALIVFGIERKNNIWIERIGNIVFLTVTFGIIAFAVYYFLNRIFTGLKQTKQIGADILEFAYVEDKAEKVIKNKNSDIKNEEAEKKIRKIYRKYVLKTIGGSVRKGDTPQAIQNKINGDLKKNDTIRVLYEKARYSNQKCDLKDVENIKKNIK